MDDEACLQGAAAGDGRVADLDRADLAALGLNRRSASPRDRSRHAAAQLQVVVRRVDDGVDILLRQVALQDFDAQAACAPGQTVGWTCQAMDAIRVSTSARVISCRPRTLKCWIVKDAITMA